MEQEKPKPEQDEQEEVLSLDEIAERFDSLHKRILHYLEEDGEAVSSEESKEFIKEAYKTGKKYCPWHPGTYDYNEGTERIEAMAQVIFHFASTESAKDEDWMRDTYSKEYALSQFQPIYDKHFDEKGKFKNVNREKFNK